MNLNNIKNTKEISEIKNPFLKDQIIGISVRSFESSFTEGKFYHQGNIKFKNGNTMGEQEFEGTSFDDVVLKIKNFLQNL